MMRVYMDMYVFKSFISYCYLLLLSLSIIVFYLFNLKIFSLFLIY